MIRRHPLGAYFAFAYLYSWGYWIPLALAGGHHSHFPGLAGPMLAAITVTALTEGPAGLRRLWSRMARWRVAGRWYLVALLPAALAAVALTALWLLPIGGPSLDEISHMPGIPAATVLGTFLLAVLINGYGEETGWRGYAIPRLRERHDPVTASLLLVVPWALWHLPLFFIDTGMRGFPLLMLPGFLVGMAAGSVVLTWVAEGSGSILIVALWHAALNMGSATEATAGWIAAMTSVLVIFWAVRVVHRGRATPPRILDAQPGASYGADLPASADAADRARMQPRMEQQHVGLMGATASSSAGASR
jgi:uncharacterized protein